MVLNHFNSSTSEWWPVHCGASQMSSSKCPTRRVWTFAHKPMQAHNQAEYNLWSGLEWPTESSTFPWSLFSLNILGNVTFCPQVQLIILILKQCSKLLNMREKFTYTYVLRKLVIGEGPTSFFFPLGCLVPFCVVLELPFSLVWWVEIPTSLTLCFPFNVQFPRSELISSLCAAFVL